jgi:hypothetical protein
LWAFVGSAKSYDQVSEPCFLLEMPWGKPHVRSNLVGDSQLKLSWPLFSFFPSVDCRCFHKYAKNVGKKKKHSNMYLVFNNIKSYLSVFVILILGLVVCYFM